MRIKYKNRAQQLAKVFRRVFDPLHMLNIGSLALLGYAIGWRLPTHYFQNFDSIYNVTAIQSAMKAQKPSLFLTFDLLTSMGNIQFGINHWLNPPALISSFDGNFRPGQFMAVTCIMIYLGAIYLSAAVFRQRNINAVFGLLSAFIVGGVSPFTISNFSRLQPSAPMILVLFCVAVGATLRILNAQSQKHLFWNFFILLLTSLIALYIYVGLAPIYVYAYGLTCSLFLGFGLWAHDRRVVARILGTSVALLFSTGVLGGLQSLAGYVLYSGQVVFGERLGKITKTSLLDVGTVFFRGWNSVTILMAICVVTSMMFVARLGSQVRHTFIRITPFFLIVNLSYHIVHVSLDREIGPLAAYIAYVFWPIYLLPVIASLAWLIKNQLPRVRPASISKNVLFLLSSGLPLLLWTTSWVIRNPQQQIDLIETDVIRALEQNFGTANNSTYNGRVALYMGSQNGNARDDDQNLSRFLNTKLAPVGVPVLDEYSHGVSAQFVSFALQTLVDTKQELVRGFIPIRRANLNVFQVMGVQAVVSNDLIRGVKKTMRFDSSPRYLHFLPGSVVTSPVIPLSRNSFQETISLIEDNSFDPLRDVVVAEVSGEKLPPLVKASFAMLRVERGGIRVTAHSTGFSLIALPIEYSHCLSIGNDGKLIRVNGIFTGVLFDSYIDKLLSYSYRPGITSNCRLEDLSDFESRLP